MNINNLPNEILLEIFDCYRHTFGNLLSSEKAWNSKNGWFKLAHVCHNWRSIVLASPSRLRVRLYFTNKTPTRAVALERLSHLPIIVDYSDVIWKGSVPKRFTSALRYPNRVCRIAIQASYNTTDSAITEALDIPFPALESLDISNRRSMERVLRSPSFMTPVQSLRHLRLDYMPLISASSLLSVTKSLVELILNTDKVFLTNGVSLFTCLQHMPRLRDLRVSLNCQVSEELPPTTSISLPELTSFCFVGERPQAEWIVAGFDTPSLQKFHIFVADFSHRLHIPYLTKLIRAVGVVFVAAQVTILGPPHGFDFRTDLFAWPNSIHDSPSKIFTIKTKFAADPDIALSTMLTTLEDIFLFYPAYMPIRGLSLDEPATWHKFFKEFRNVKVLRLLHGLETQVVEMLRQPTVNTLPPQEEAYPDATVSSSTPIITKRSELISDIFPSLEEIVLYVGQPYSAFPNREKIGETERASMLKLFGPFVTARHELGHPVEVFWSKDEVPLYSTMAYEIAVW